MDDFGHQRLLIYLVFSFALFECLKSTGEYIPVEYKNYNGDSSLHGFRITCSIPTNITSTFKMDIYWVSNLKELEKIINTSGQHSEEHFPDHGNESDHSLTEFNETEISILNVFTIWALFDEYQVSSNAHWQARAKLVSFNRTGNLSVAVQVEGLRAEDFGYYLCLSNNTVIDSNIFEHTMETLFHRLQLNPNARKESPALCTELFKVRQHALGIWQRTDMRLKDGESGDAAQLECSYMGGSPDTVQREHCSNTSTSVNVNVHPRWESVSFLSAWEPLLFAQKEERMWPVDSQYRMLQRDIHIRNVYYH